MSYNIGRSRKNDVSAKDALLMMIAVVKNGDNGIVWHGVLEKGAFIRYFSQLFPPSNR